MSARPGDRLCKVCKLRIAAVYVDHRQCRQSALKLNHLLAPCKNVSHFQRLDEASISLYDVDCSELIPFWEAVNKLGAGFPSSDTRNLHIWQG